MFEFKNTQIEFNYMGLFTTSSPWIHPAAKEETYEIIYVSEGEVHIKEGKRKITLNKGDLVILKPHILHKGFKKSTGSTSFYWVHFYVKNESDIFKADDIFKFDTPSLFKELMHYSHMPHPDTDMAEAVLCHILALILFNQKRASVSRVSENVVEWTRINISRKLTVQKIANNFGYNGEYLSRLTKENFGLSLKQLIDDFLIKKSREYLSNSNYSIKEISNILEFSSPNTFVKFFKYHENISPKKFRDNYTYVHMNKK